MSARVTIAALVCATLAMASPAGAQPDDAKAGSEAKSDIEETADAESDASDAGGDEQAADEGEGGASHEDEGEADEAEGGGTDTDPAESEDKAYRFIGLRFRDFIAPEFMMDIFADGGATVNAFTFGPAFTTRKDQLEPIFALSYCDYSMNPTPFQGTDVNAYA